MKFVSPENPPEGLERELLVILNEECSEVAHRICKALRFGLNEVQPGQSKSNAERIVEELGDLIATFEYLEDEGTLNLKPIGELIKAKKFKLQKYLQNV